MHIFASKRLKLISQEKQIIDYILWLVKMELIHVPVYKKQYFYKLFFYKIFQKNSKNSFRQNMSGQTEKQMEKAIHAKHRNFVSDGYENNT